MIRTFLEQESYGPGLIDRGEVGHMNSSGIFFCFSIFFFPLLNQSVLYTYLMCSERKVFKIFLILRPGAIKREGGSGSGDFGGGHCQAGSQ